MTATALLLGCAPVIDGRAPAKALPASQVASSACGDLLVRLGKKPRAARYVGCASVPERQGAPVRATYEVAGADAAEVEAYLARVFGLPRLKRSCCQWDSAPVGFVDTQGRQFVIAMVSDETAVHRREEWGLIGTFHLTVEMLTDDI